MSVINAYGDPIIINWEIDDNGEKISIPILNETKQVVGNKLVLEGLPDEQYRVFIDGFIEINIKEKITETNQFKVDYRKNGVVFVHENLDGQWLTISKYSSRGVYFIPSSRIWTKINDFGEVVETLDATVSKMGLVSDTIINLGTAVSEANTTKVLLDGSISTATTTKAGLDTSVGIANTSKINLDGSVTTANTAKSDLDTSIIGGTALKGELDSIIAGSDLENAILDIADLKTDQHNHVNKTVLDDLTDVGGYLQYKGVDVGKMTGLTWGAFV